jgi:methylated-DNA-[protein]-cysteine S-methyltransferase
MSHLSLLTPLGALTLFAEAGAIVALEWGEAPRAPLPPEPLLREAATQLQDYFDGLRRDFDLPLAPAGTPFRRTVWAALTRIPYGATWSYRDLAAAVGCRSARAIGQANGANPIPILIPCHRVIAANGGLGGYSGGDGVATKRYLLDLETRAAGSPQFETSQGTPR